MLICSSIAILSSYYGKLLLGHHTWHVHNDDACIEDADSYDAEISLRYNQSIFFSNVK